MSVLFVCVGNTCRSPMLEYMFKDYLSANGFDSIEVASAGIVDQSERLSPYAATVLAAHAIQFDANRISELCDLKKIEAADCVIAMTAEIADYLKKEFNGPNIVAMRDVSGEDVPDPYGKGLEEYERIYKMLSRALPDIYRYLI